MRFSIKWLLAATAYAAVVCRSVVYASTVWGGVLAFAVVLALVFSLIGVGARSGRLRSFFLGYAVAAVAIQLAVFTEENSAVSPLARCGGVIRDKVTIPISRIFDLHAQLQTLLQNELAVGEEFVEFIRTPDAGNGYHLTYNIREPRSGRIRTETGVLSDPAIADRVWTVREAIITYHLVFLFSLLGGLLGLWFWKREKDGGGTAA